MLKSAYLFAFYKLGYRYILKTKLNGIRKQILCPNEDILPPFYNLFNESYIPNNRPDGVYIFSLDGERVLVVIMTLKLTNSNYRHRIATVLPMPDQEDLDFYKRLSNKMAKGGIDVQFIGRARIG